MNKSKLGPERIASEVNQLFSLLIFALAWCLWKTGSGLYKAAFAILKFKNKYDFETGIIKE